ncbi:MAG: methyltransferase type 11 [Chloroflexi bacterium B3_Chlor]|nr:MAG: methyltransferase type 11 [Chloroflexi bacterium B3_Chlor]
MDEVENREIKLCCATFYESDLVRMLLGDVLHPGGLALTERLGRLMGLGPDQRVLDVACGRGASAVHLAERFGCHVTGLDYGTENVAAAQALAADRGIARLTAFRQGDAEALPFDDATFDAVISECSFCTFPDKATAATEMARVLRPASRLGLADITVSGTLPEDLQTLLGWVACVAGAGTPEEYVATLEKAGFAHFTVEDQRDALLEMVQDVRRKLLAVELAVGLGKLDLGELDLSEGKRLARRAVDLIESGVVGYGSLRPNAVRRGRFETCPYACAERTLRAARNQKSEFRRQDYSGEPGETTTRNPMTTR